MIERIITPRTTLFTAVLGLILLTGIAIADQHPIRTIFVEASWYACGVFATWLFAIKR
jgi:hypothetical protein